MTKNLSEWYADRREKSGLINAMPPNAGPDAWIPCWLREMETKGVAFCDSPDRWPNVRA